MQRQFILSEAVAMEPLVRAVVRDLREALADRAAVRQRDETLATCRGSKHYEVRRQSHESQRAVEAADHRLDALNAELEDLAVVALDLSAGVVGFPFLWSPKRNSKKVRQAFFLLKLDDARQEGIHSWRFADEEHIRRIPEHWFNEQESKPPRLGEVELRPD